MKDRMWRETQPRRTWVVAGGALVLLALGAGFAHWASWRQDQWMREDLLAQACQFAQTLNADHLATLKGNPSDEQKPEYHRLKKQLIAAQQIDPRWKWIYLMGRATNRAVFFQINSEAYDVSDPTSPGRPFEDASNVLQGVFDQRQAAIEGPVTDRWGIWISTYVPVQDPRTGRLLTVVGIDIEASLWKRIRLQAIWMPLLFCVAMITLWLGGNHLLARRSRRQNLQPWFCLHLESLLAVAVGLVLTLAIIWLIRQFELRNQQVSFRRLADAEFTPLVNAAQNLRDLEMNGFASLFESSDEVTGEEFHQYADHLACVADVMFWGWVDVVEARDRAEFETNAALRTGKPDFRIWELDGKEHPVAAGARERFYPVVYLVPKEKNEFALGFDLGSDPARREEIEAVARTRLPTAVPSVSILQSGDIGKILLVRHASRPEHPEKLNGLVVAGLDIRQWLKANQSAPADRRSMATFDMLELRSGQPPLRLGTTGEQEAAPPELNSLPPLSIVRPLLAFGKAYAIVARPTVEFTRLRMETSVWLLGLAGLVLTGSVAWVLGLFANRRETLARLVDEQSRELAASMHHYGLLAKQNRTITWELDLEGLYTDISDMATVVIGYRPEEMIGKMHFYDLCPEKDREEFKTMGLALLRSGETAMDVVNSMVTKSGEVIWVSSSGIPIRDAQGNVRGYWGTDTDITGRKRAEEALARMAKENQEAAERYAALALASDTGAWEYDDSTKRLWCSPEYFTLLGYDPAEFDLPPERRTLDALWLDLVHPGDRETARRDLAAHLKNPRQAYDLRFRMRRKNGTWAWIWSRGQTLFDKAGHPTSKIVGTHIDITDAMHAEEALRESEQKYRMLTENMKDVVWIADVEAQRFLYVSPSVEKLRGFTPAEILAQPLEAAWAPEQREELARKMAGYVAEFHEGKIASDTYVTLEMLQPCKDGSAVSSEVVCRLWKNARTGKLELHGVTRDITERKRIETELRESNERLSLFIRNSPVYAFIKEVSPTESRVLQASENYTQMIGIAGSDMVGKTMAELFPAEIAAKFTADDWMVVSKGEVLKLDENFNGRHYTTIKFPIIQGGRTLLAGYTIDITERKRAEEALAGAVHRYNLLAKQNGIVTWELDLQGCYIDLGDQTLDTTQYRPDELVRKTFFYELHPEKGREEFKAEVLGHVANGTPFRDLIHPVTNKSGGLTWFSSSGIPTYDDRGNLRGAWGTSTDITERRRAEEALRESEQKYRMLTETMKDVVWIMDVETLKFLYISPSVEKLRGFTPAEAMAGTVANSLEPGQIETLVPMLRQHAAEFMRGEIGSDTFFPLELRQPCKGGGAIITEAVTRFWKNEQTGRLELHGVTRDITDRKRAEENFHTLFQNMVEGFALHEIVCDAQGKPVDYRFLAVNPAFERLTGLKAADIIGKTALEALPDLEKKWIEIYGNVALTGSPAFFDNYSTPLARHYEVTAFRPAPGQFACIFSDVTERKLAESERERLIRAIEQSGETILITDAKGVILYVNPAFTRVTGFSREEALGQNPSILQSGKHGPAFYREMWKTLKAGQTWEGQIINKRKDGSLYTEQAAISPVRDASGSIVNFVAVKRDITQQLLAEEEKASLREQLAHAQKLESVGRLAGGVAHDFNNMLQAILGYIEMAIEQVPPDQPLHADLREIQKAAMSSTSLTKQLQAFARKQVAEPKVLDLNEAVEGMFSMLRRLIGEDIQVIWKPGRNIGPVKIDPGQLDQVVANLCINARDAIGKSGHITLETSLAKIPAPSGVPPGDIEPGTYALLSVRDDGGGMGQDVIGHIFEPFFTTKPVGKGTGLGLSTVYGIVKQNGGGIRVDSEPGKGSTFRIYLPRHVRKDPEPEPPPIGTDELTSARHETILLVEDEETILRTTRRILESIGYQVFATDSPQDALRIADERQGQIDLLLTDVIMSGMNGPELVRHLQARHPAIKCLFMSGYTANLLAEQGVKASNSDFIQKPFSRKQLAQKVREALAKK